MPSLELMSEVSRDPHLLERLAQCAAIEGVEHPEDWVRQNARKLISVPIQPGEPVVSIAWVWEIGVKYRREHPIPEDPPSPYRWREMGQDPTVVSDAQIRNAVTGVLNPVH